MPGVAFFQPSVLPAPQRPYAPGDTGLARQVEAAHQACGGRRKGDSSPLGSGFGAFEDAIQYFAAEAEGGVGVIITRNKADYAASRLPVMSPEEYLPNDRRSESEPRVPPHLSIGRRGRLALREPSQSWANLLPGLAAVAHRFPSFDRMNSVVTLPAPLRAVVSDRWYGEAEVCFPGQLGEIFSGHATTI